MPGQALCQHLPGLAKPSHACQSACVCRSERTVAMPAGFTAAAGSSAAAPLAYYQSSGVQKAVLLARYTDLLQGW